jgi:cell division protein FtsZ
VRSRTHSTSHFGVVDVKTIITNSGRAIMGTGIAEGKDRAKHAALHALSNPLLGQVDMLNYFAPDKHT